VTIVHVQRADALGHCHAWGPLGVTREAALAARRVLVVAEEIWPTGRILADPNLVLLPAFKVAAVVHEPWGAFPSPLQGCYGRDHASFAQYHAESGTPAGFRAWLDRWVLGPRDWPGLLGVLGPERLAELRPRRRLPSEPLDYGA
jgi:glutaconate CoA-transferase subunit A